MFNQCLPSPAGSWRQGGRGGPASPSGPAEQACGAGRLARDRPAVRHPADPVLPAAPICPCAAPTETHGGKGVGGGD